MRHHHIHQPEISIHQNPGKHCQETQPLLHPNTPRKVLKLTPTANTDFLVHRFLLQLLTKMLRNRGHTLKSFELAGNRI